MAMPPPWFWPGLLTLKPWKSRRRGGYADHLILDLKLAEALLAEAG